MMICLHFPVFSFKVNLMLRENEFMYSFTDDNNTVLSYESNQLRSNFPCEDSRTEASFNHKPGSALSLACSSKLTKILILLLLGFVCGIFDGHAGPACSQVISKRLLRYIAASLVDRSILKEHIKKGCNSQSFLKCHNDKVS